MKLLSSEYDPLTGFTDEYWFDEMTNKLTIRRWQDVEDTLDDNRAQFNMHAGKKPSYKDSNGVHKVARIPMAIIEKLYREKGFNWFQSTDAERRTILNDREYSKFLVRPGKL